MNQRNRRLVVLLGCVFAVIAAARVVPVVATGGSLGEDIHWLVYGYDRVSYHHRDYINPVDYTAAEVEQKFGQGEQFIPTGDKVRGLAVYDTPRSLQFQKKQGVVSTLLFLRKSDGNFIVYELSGGP